MKASYDRPHLQVEEERCKMVAEFWNRNVLESVQFNVDGAIKVTSVALLGFLGPK
jgi:hypothetical protein